MSFAITDKVKVLMIDNYDSFTYNLVHYIDKLDIEVQVKRNDQVTIRQVVELSPTHIIISPGPCTPNEAGISLELIDALKGKMPILGVCLGHQAIGQCFGATVVKADKIMHGKTSKIIHTGIGVFKGIPQNFDATRYHSLVLDKKRLPNELELTAWTEGEDGELEAIMGIKHLEYDIHGIQFHPESLLSEHGLAILKNFLK